MTERRVRRVRLSAASRALVQRGAILLEDALRTATLPDAPGGRVIAIRQLSLGTIRADRSPAALSLVLERRVRELGAALVHAESEAAPTAPAVYFSDSLEPFVALATRLARALPVDGWFWPLAVPGLRPGMARDEALRLALAGALRTEPGPAAAVLLVSELQARGALEPLLGSLRWEDGPALARAWWGFLPSRPEAVLLVGGAGVGEQVSARLRDVVSRWAGTWGPEDARSLWLTAVALCAERPARVADRRLPARAWRVLGALQAPSPARPVEPPGPPRPPSTAPSPASSQVGTPGASPRAEPSPRAPPAPPGEARPMMEDAGLSERPEAAPGPRAARPPGALAGPRQEAPASRPPEPPVSVSEEAATARLAPPPEEDAPVSAPDGSLPTAVGGLLFLVPVLESLGLAELLAAHPALVELAFPERLLHLVATRLGAPATDPLLRILEAAGAAPPPSPCPFVLPARFRAGVGAREPFRLVREPGGRRVAFDARGRVPLAVVPDGAAVPAPFERLAATGLERPVPWDDLTLLLRAALLGVGRVMRTRVRLGLRELVLRPGRVVSTRTHLDVVFDHQQADLRIRRAGLDVDPGWVPWLARVIRYHYMYGETEDA